MSRGGRWNTTFSQNVSTASILSFHFWLAWIHCKMSRGGRWNMSDGRIVSFQTQSVSIDCLFPFLTCLDAIQDITWWKICHNRRKHVVAHQVVFHPRLVLFDRCSIVVHLLTFMFVTRLDRCGLSLDRHIQYKGTYVTFYLVGSDSVIYW